MNIRSDFLVIGSGIAGLMYALEIAETGRVAVLCKNEPTEGSTQYAQGGIATVTSPLDSFDSHISDTTKAGAGLCHKDIVESVVREGPQCIERLIALGARFDKERDSETYQLGQEGGHSARRILHARDTTGREVQRAIFQQASRHPNITIYPYHIAIDFILNSDSNEVAGVYALNCSRQAVVSFTARATMLATGGVGKVYMYTSNPDVATGDGIAMAYRAGANIANMEFIQFHPTCLYHPQAKSFLITEAMRGEGARLLTAGGAEFMSDYHESAELAPRDVVARAIDDIMKKTGDDYVLLDISHRAPDFVKSRFPNIYSRTKEFGFDITHAPIPVVPAAHYCCGGVQSDINGRTNLKRLYTAGETACTGLHGANRLASNSLLEALVFASRSVADTLENLPSLDVPGEVPAWDYLDTCESSEEVLVSHSWDEVRRIMWNLVGIVRNDKRLQLAEKRLENIKEEIRDYYWKYRVTQNLIELRNIIDVAEIIIRSASLRKESRGLHYNSNYPQANDDFAQDTIISRPR